MNLPDELMNELTDAWKRGDRENVSRIIDDVGAMHCASELTKELVRDILNDIDQSPFSTSEMNNLEYAIHQRAENSLWSYEKPHILGSISHEANLELEAVAEECEEHGCDMDHDECQERGLNGFLEMQDINWNLAARILMYRVRAMELV